MRLVFAPGTRDPSPRAAPLSTTTESVSDVPSESDCTVARTTFTDWGPIGTDVEKRPVVPSNGTGLPPTSSTSAAALLPITCPPTVIDAPGVIVPLAGEVM